MSQEKVLPESEEGKAEVQQKIGTSQENCRESGSRKEPASQKTASDGKNGIVPPHLVHQVIIGKPGRDACKSHHLLRLVIPGTRRQNKLLWRHLCPQLALRLAQAVDPRRSQMRQMRQKVVAEVV